jgi:hypothetical protein
VINQGPWRFGLDESHETADVERVILMLRAAGVPAKKIRPYVMIGHEPFADCMARIKLVLKLGGEPYVQPIIKLNARRQEPWVQHDWTPMLLKRVQRWANRRGWRKAPDFADYRPSAKTSRDKARDRSAPLFGEERCT